MLSKRGQVTIFVIVAVLIVGGIIAYFAVRGGFGPGVEIPEDFQKVFDYYSSCAEAETRQAIELAGSQGGRVYAGEYTPGSDFAPFSNQLNFLGFPVPYWYYVAGNGLVKESVPLKSDIEKEIERYVEENLNENCNFQELYERGVYIALGEPRADVKISDSKVDVSVSSKVTASNSESSASQSSFKKSVSSRIGSLYATALGVYKKEKNDAFLESYSVDVLRMYAPVDGVELGCSGKVWKTREVIGNLVEGLEANMGMIKFKGDYYTLSDDKNKYFVVDENVNNAVRMIYSREWPSKIEIYGSDGELMIAEPVGTQRGLGIIGFCYAPYHFVYDLSFPVMIQVYDENEVFQFPVAVIIDKNAPRVAYLSNISYDEPDFDLCEFKNSDIEVDVYDSNLNPVDASLSFECFNQRCALGETENGIFSGKAPACVNGRIVARAEGYVESSKTFSTNEEVLAELILDREKEIKVDLRVDGEELEGSAIVSFNGEKYSASSSLPDSSVIKLAEGLYNVTVYVYGNASLTIPASSKTICNEVPKSGILGFFGGTRNECQNIEIPETRIESALIGGGKAGDVYIFDSDLDKVKMVINVGRLATPNSMDDLQQNYAVFDTMKAVVSFE